MRVTYRATPNLPSDIVVALVEGERESVILIDERASATEIAAAMNESVTQWIREEWLHVGRCMDDRPDLKAVG